MAKGRGKGSRNIDYDKLYQEFFKSKHHELSSFLREKKYIKKGGELSDTTRSMQEKTKNWAMIKKLELQSVQVEAKGKAKEENLKLWRQVYGNVEKAEMAALDKLTHAVSEGWEQERLVVKKGKKGEKTVIEKRKVKLSFSQTMAVLDKMRLVQGKAGEITAFMGQDGESDPLRERLSLLKKLRKLKTKK